jgi:hypothetical protein
VASVVELRVDPEEPDEDEVGIGVVPETTGGAKPDAAVMSLSSDPDINAAARPEHAAIASSRDRRGDRLVIADDQPLRVAAGFIAVLSGRGLVAQAELQAAIAVPGESAVACAAALTGECSWAASAAGLAGEELAGASALAVATRSLPASGLAAAAGCGAILF